MSGMTNTLIMFGISTVAALIQAIFWRWVSMISDARKEDGKKIESLSREVVELRAEVYKKYQTKEDSHRDSQKILDALKDIKTDVGKLSDKLDKKADK